MKERDFFHQVYAIVHLRDTTHEIIPYRNKTVLRSRRVGDENVQNPIYEFRKSFTGCQDNKSGGATIQCRVAEARFVVGLGVRVLRAGSIGRDRQV